MRTHAAVLLGTLLLATAPASVAGAPGVDDVVDDALHCTGDVTNIVLDGLQEGVPWAAERVQDAKCEANWHDTAFTIRPDGDRVPEHDHPTDHQRDASGVLYNGAGGSSTADESLFYYPSGHVRLQLVRARSVDVSWTIRQDWDYVDDHSMSCVWPAESDVSCTGHWHDGRFVDVQFRVPSDQAQVLAWRIQYDARTLPVTDVESQHDARGDVAAVSTGGGARCEDDGDLYDRAPCVAASLDDDARGDRVGVTGTGEARCDGWSPCLAASGTGPARCVDADGCAAVSGTGPAGDEEAEAAVSGSGQAHGLVAVSGTGPADGSATAATTTGDASCGWITFCTATTLTGDASCETQREQLGSDGCAAVSATGRAHGDNRASLCNGVGVLGVTYWSGAREACR